MAAATALPLTGVRVIDFGRFIAGPYCAMLLADMGADVIRVERRQGGEDRYLAPVAATGEGSGFLSLNRNKRSMTLDLGKPGAAMVVRRLVKTADVVIANLPPQVLKRLGLDYETLSTLKPDLILGQISAFGSTGPYADRAGFDTVAQAMSGAMHLTGFPGPPVRSIVPFADYGTALHTAFGIMAALYYRAKTGEGQAVTGSLLATGVTFMQNMLAEHEVLGTRRAQQGNTSFYAGPSDAYQAIDGGWITVSVAGDDMFARWARLVGREELIADPNFAADQQRANRHEVTNAIMKAWLTSRTSAQALAELEAARIPCGPVLGLQQVLEHPQVNDCKLLQPIEFPGVAKPVPVAAPAATLSRTPGTIRRRAPVLGEHTDEVLLEIGYTRDEIDELKKVEII